MANWARGHRAAETFSKSQSGQKNILSNAYQELGKELYSTQIKVVGNYTLGRVIGEGSFGCVRLALNRLTSTRCAIKQIPRSATPPLLTREIHHHRQLHHPHVVQLYEIIATETSIWLVFELCAGGELFDYLVEQGRLQEVEARRIFGQLCLALGYVHAQGVVHRDLKLENVLLDEKCNVKVADFGFGREFDKNKLMETYCGTTGYASPEMLAGRKYTGEEVDIWSIGIILYALLTGSLPFDDDDEEVMKSKIQQMDYEIPTWLPEEARDLISSILVYEPKERPSVKQILSHPWFSKVVLPTSFSDQAISVEPLPASIPEEHDQLYSPETYEPQTPLPYHSLSSSAIDSEPSYFSNTAPGSLALTNESVTPLTSEAGTSNTTTSQSTARQVSQHRPTASTSSLYTKPRIPVASTSGTTSPRASIDDEIGTPFRFPRAPPVATPISRSSSSGLGSPAIPMTIHSRTPSRTKRRSVGSNFSERLLLPLHLQSTINYLALLDRTETAPLTQPLDSRLLDNLSAVGFDTAQITHSVKTDACDCSSAMWWQLRKKTEEKEEAEREAGLRSPVSPADSLRTRRAKQSSESGVSMTPSRPTISQYTYEPPTPEARARANSSPEPSPRRRESERRSSKDIASSPFSSSATPFVSAPSLSYPLHSRSSEDLIDRDAIQTTPRKRDEPATPPTTYGLAASTPPSSHTINASTPSPSRSLEPDAKGKGKPRSASVSMLQRATSAFSKSDKLPTPESTDSGRSTPLAGFFRKSTNASESRPSLIEKLSKDRLRDHWSPPPASISKPLPSDDSHEYNQSPSSPPVESADESLLMSSTTSHDTHNSASTAASTTEDLSSPKLGENKPRNRGSLFSNFKLWFNEDRRKRKRQTTLAGFEGSSVAKLRVASPTTPAHRRQMSAFTESPLRGPSSRRSSTGAPTLPTSRRSSIKSPRHLSSAERLTQAHGQGRRRSVSSRTSFDRPNPGDMTPSSDRGHHSRPVSMISADLSDHLASSDIQLVRSSSSGGQQRQSRHKKASSFGSAASHRSNRDSSSPAPPFRRPPTSTTQVRRVTKGHARPPPHRRNSNASHQSASSRRSSLSDLDSNASPMIGIDHEVILEDEETENADIERAKALRKLSGDAGSIQPDKQHSRHSTDGSQGSIGRTVFTAHKSSSAFSSPAVTGATHHSRASSSTIRPKFRDVFANKTSQEDSEWVDEDDPLDGLGCGFGQNTLFTAGASPTDGDMFPGGSILGSGRYAGVNEAFFGGRSESKQGGQPRPVGLGLRSGTVIEEEEEEE